MGQHNSTPMKALLEEIAQSGAEDMRGLLTQMWNMAMVAEREQFLGATSHERNSERRAYANGYKEKTLNTSAGTLHLSVPQTRGHSGEAFYPESLERGRRSTRALIATVSEMYVAGVSTRDVEKVLAEFGIENISSSFVSRAVRTLDEGLNAWRNRPIGVIKYLLLDARYEKVRINGVVRDVALLSAIGIDGDGRRSILGTSVSLSEHEVHWREFLESLVSRGMRGVEYVVSDAHVGLKAARRAVFGGAMWQRCQFHLAANAIQRAPNNGIRKSIGSQLASVWNATTLAKAQERLVELVAEYRVKHPEFADWLENNIPEGLIVFQLPEEHRKRMRTSNGIERCVQQEIKRRTRKIRVFPNPESLLRLATAILQEIDESWAAKPTPYIDWSVDETP